MGISTPAAGSRDVASRAVELASQLAQLAEELNPPTLAALSGQELSEWLGRWHRFRSIADGAIIGLQGEANGREQFRADGATSSTRWQEERFGLSSASARSYDQVAEAALDLPHLRHALRDGDITLDKVRAVAGVATAETDQELAEVARRSSVHELGQFVKSMQRPTAAGAEADRAARSLRFNESRRTMSVQFPLEDFVAVRARVEAQAKALPTSEGETLLPWDQRCYDAFMGMLSAIGPGTGQGAGTGLTLGAATRTFTVLHTPLHSLIDESGRASELCGDLERGGLIDIDSVRRLVCDSTFVIGVDDRWGHTMYEGRARRSPTAAQRREIWRRDRCCRFPGCPNAVFTEPHHLRWWTRGGRTDLPNLALLCKHHHGLVHSKGWQVTGDANAVVTFVTPDGRAMDSWPSPLWSAASETATSGSSPNNGGTDPLPEKSGRRNGTRPREGPPDNT